LSGTLGIMQPYFFPYLGYFSLMHAVDRWVVFDTSQYIRRGWVNRNRVLTLGNDDWKYIQIPTKKAPRETPISRIEISTAADWRTDIVRNLDYYEHHKAPYYEPIREFVLSTFESESGLLSAQLNHMLKCTCDLLQIEHAQFDVFSRMDLTIGPVTHAGEWALRISETLNADTYVNPPGGRDIFEARDFQDLGISLQFLESNLQPYNQGPSSFVSGLSILDCLMWLGPQETRNHIEQFKLVDA
jgi:hypothetical protein